MKILRLASFFLFVFFYFNFSSSCDPFIINGKCHIQSSRNIVEPIIVANDLRNTILLKQPVLENIATLSLGVQRKLINNIYEPCVHQINSDSNAQLLVTDNGRINIFEDTILNNKVIIPSILVIDNNKYKDNCYYVVSNNNFSILDKKATNDPKLNANTNFTSEDKITINKQNNYFSSNFVNLSTLFPNNLLVDNSNKLKIENIANFALHNSEDYSITDSSFTIDSNSFYLDKKNYKPIYSNNNFKFMNEKDFSAGIFVHNGAKLIVGEKTQFYSNKKHSLPVVNLCGSKSFIDLSNLLQTNNTQALIISSTSMLNAGKVNIFKDLSHNSDFNILKEKYENSIKNSTVFSKIELVNVGLLNPAIDVIKRRKTMVYTKNNTRFINAINIINKEYLLPDNINNYFGKNSNFYIVPFTVNYKNNKKINIEDARLSWTQFLSSKLNNSQNNINLNIKKHIPFTDWSKYLPLGGKTLNTGLYGSGKYIIISKGKEKIVTFNNDKYKFSGTLEANKHISKIIYKKDFISVIKNLKDNKHNIYKNKHNICKKMKSKYLSYEFSGPKFNNTIKLNKHKLLCNNKFLLNNILITKDRNLKLISNVATSLAVKSLNCAGGIRVGSNVTLRLGGNNNIKHSLKTNIVPKIHRIT